MEGLSIIEDIRKGSDMKKVKMVVLIGLAVLGVVYAGTRPEKMTREQKNIQLVKVALEAACGGEFEELKKLYSPRFVQHQPGNRESTYWKQFELGLRMAQEYFNGISYNIEDIVAEGDKVVVRMSSSIEVTNNKGTQYETEHKMEMTEICIYRIKGGRIVEEWCEYDYTSMEGQVKAIVAGRMFR